MRGYLLAVLAAITIAAGLFVGTGGSTSASTTVVVSPGSLVTDSSPTGWYFWNDKNDTLTGSPGTLVSGPATPPLGSGSVRLGPLTDDGTTAAGHSVIATNAYFGTPLANLTAMSYSTYQAGPTQAIAIQFDVRYRTTDTAYGGRLVYEPYQNGAVTVGSGWQNWSSPLTGLWWASKTTTAGTGGAQVVPLPAGNCAQSTPCTWAQIMAAFPNAQIYGRFVLKAGSNWNGFDGNADNLTVGVSGNNTTYDFEPDCSLDCYVRPDGNDANTGSANTAADAKQTIQAALNVVSTGGTVHVAAGTYAQDLVINRAVTLEGAGQGSTILEPSTSVLDCSGGGAGSLCTGGPMPTNVIRVESSNVTIHDLTVDGDNPSINSGTVVGGADLNARNGIITNHILNVPYANLVVHHTTVKNIFLRGVYSSTTGGSFNFHDNTVQNVQADGASIAMFNSFGSGSFTNNTVSDASDAISSNWSMGTTYSGNVITNSLSGVHSDNNGGAGGVADSITNNTVSNCQPDGYGVWAFAPYRSITLSQNTVINCAVGLTAAGQQAAVTVSFVDNVVDGQNLANSTGAFLTTWLFGFGDANSTVSMTGNIITNTQDGVFLYTTGSGTTLAVNAQRNSISGNTNSGVSTQVTAGTTLLANMTPNWWGDASGPAHALNPGGTGDSVADGVIYSPWIGIGTDASGAAGYQLASPMDWIAGPAVCGATCIQAAIDDASNGDTIKAKTGVFPEHVIVNKDVTVTHTSLPIIDAGGSGDAVTITASGATLDGFEIRNSTNGVVVTGANNATVINNNIHNFTSAGLRSTNASGADYSTNTITGPHTASCAGGFWGMFTTNTSGVLNGNIISGIGNGLLSGCQEGRAIEVTGSGSPQITNNTISQYQKSGIITRGTVAAMISGNTTTGEGPTSAIAQNGITITSTGNTSITNNNTSGHRYTAATTSGDFSCGILYAPFGPTANAAVINGNQTTGDQTGICLSNAFAGGPVSGVQVKSNIVTNHHERGIDIDGMTNVSVTLNNIDGQAGGTSATPGTGPDTDLRYYGIMATDSTGTVSNNSVKGITHGPSNGLQSGVGIRVSARSGKSANMTLSGNIISDIQKNAIVVLNPYGGTSVNANVTNNTVTGNGPINYIAQNGIQISNGATATVSGNNASGYDYTPNTAAAIGILVFGAGPTSVTNNVVHDLMEGMYVQQTNNAIVTGNQFSNYRDTAIFVYLSNNGTYTSNTFAGNKPASLGMYFYDVTTNNSVQQNSIRFNDVGVVLDYSAGAPTGNAFAQNCIADNTSFGMEVLPTQSGGPVNAENNWWGKVDGPNPPGHGDKLDDATTIDAIPFLTAAVAGCPVPADGDGDGLNDPVDNCPAVYNPSQENTNAEVMPLPKPVPAWNDVTNPAGDFLGDACDPDIDGDGVPNGTEVSMGLSPYSWDTDGDRTNDGTEIACGSNPLSAASNLSGLDSDNDRLPNACEAIYGTNPSLNDSDGDKILDGVEVRYWLTDPLSQNTDGDDCGDGREVASINGDRTVNSGDMGILASKIGQPTAQFRPYDQNGDGVFNSGDQGFQASRYGPCP